VITNLINARIFTPDEIVEKGTLVISNHGIIAYIGSGERAPNLGGERLDLQGGILAPGFIDIHVHGGGGFSFEQPETIPSELAGYAQWVTKSGVTGFLCTISAPAAESLLHLVGALADVLDRGTPGAQALGIHLEGPWLNPERAGAFPPGWLREPDPEEARRLLGAGRGWIRQVTVAPELVGAGELASVFRDAGVTVALGHSQADFETARAALAGDYDLITHTFNAQGGFHHRHPGVVGAVLTSRGCHAELIADGIHVHPAVMALSLRCLGADRIVLITDGMAGAGMNSGTFRLLGRKVTVQEGRATLSNGSLAGSVTTLDRCVALAHHKLGVPLAEALPMASLNPARAMGLGHRLGSLAKGRDANLVWLDDDLQVQGTMVNGKWIYRK
jgi:N-acetylglucosamine-6-phosphate deacetylase